jgi:quercetin dioxygenase-like cupin family protein
MMLQIDPVKPAVTWRMPAQYRWRKSMRGAALIVSILLGAIPLGHTAQSAEGGSIVQPDALKWMPAQGLPPGAQVALLSGDPTKSGEFVVRFKFPAGYELATHSHPTDEYLTIISGKARMAFGEKADSAHAQPLPVSAFTILPAGAWHHLWADQETVVELHSTGPFAITLAK